MANNQSRDKFGSRLANFAAGFEAVLADLLSERLLPGEICRPATLLGAMRYATLEGGKRIRPFLLVETARLFGVDGEGPMRAAAALEMVHCYSLVHDDLPAMDDDDLRRGRPTVHRVYDEATAILAGDALLTYAFDIMADDRTHGDGAIRAALVVGLARAAGLGGMAGGQTLDLAAEARSMPLAADAIRQIQAMKTGALLAFGVEAGGMIGGADARMRAALSAYSRAVGAAFQIADDILDAEGDEEAIGKRIGKDAGRNKPTLVAALGLEQARQERNRLVGEAERALIGVLPAERAGVLVEAGHFIANRNT
jgi:farnesyl diphosphate synthase